MTYVARDRCNVVLPVVSALESERLEGGCPPVAREVEAAPWHEAHRNLHVGEEFIEKGTRHCHERFWIHQLSLPPGADEITIGSYRAVGATARDDSNRWLGTSKRIVEELPP